MARADPQPPTDDEILALLGTVTEAEDRVDDMLRAADDDADQDQLGELCPACGNPAEYLGQCHICDTEGCLPPDLWTPGQPDNCLTLCVRCARTVHTFCAIEDMAGNPVCPTCKF